MGTDRSVQEPAGGSDGMWGSDPESLRELAAAVRRAARQLDGLRREQDARLRFLLPQRWIGPDAEVFRRSWEDQASAPMWQASLRLDDRAARLEAHADAQDAASAGHGRAAGIGPVPGTGPGGTGTVVRGPAPAAPSPPVSSPSAPPAPVPTPPVPGSGAEHAAEWWDRLTPVQRQAVVTADPQSIGALDGLPATVRDRANRAVLAEVLADPAHPGHATARQVEDALVLDHGGPTQLLQYAAQDDGRVHTRISFGDLDAAGRIAVHTPGAGSADDIVGAGSQAARLRVESERLAADGAGTATVLNLGYDVPDGALDPAAHSDRAARDGATSLDALLTGIAAQRGTDPQVTLVGHSYGSALTGIAARGSSVVDAEMHLGSPGIGTDELVAGSAPVYALETDRDWVTSSGFHGRDVSRIDGVTLLSTDAGDGYRAGQGHHDYLAGLDTARAETPRAVGNVAAVIAGRPDLTVAGTEDPVLGGISEASRYVTVDGRVIGIAQGGSIGLETGGRFGTAVGERLDAALPGDQSALPGILGDSGAIAGGTVGAGIGSVTGHLGDLPEAVAAVDALGLLPDPFEDASPDG